MSAANRRRERPRQSDEFRKVFAVATETAIMLLTVVVVSRRLSGAFHEPVSPAVPCLVATLAALLSLAALTLGRQATPIVATRTWTRWTATAAAVFTPLALGAALWITPSAFVGGYLGALGVASLLAALAIDDLAAGFVLTSSLRSALFQLGEHAGTGAMATALSGHVVPRMPTQSCGHATHQIGVEDGTGGAPDTPVDEESEAMPNEERDCDDSIVQWMTRRRLPDGGEMIEGAVRIDLDPTEKIGVAHLSFSPPLGCDPKAECHLLCDFDGRVRITAAKSYGLRIEARQSDEATFGTTIKIAFSAEAPPAASRAAAA
jgi:hypothetical protein